MSELEIIINVLLTLLWVIPSCILGVLMLLLLIEWKSKSKIGRFIVNEIGFLALALWSHGWGNTIEYLELYWIVIIISQIILITLSIIMPMEKDKNKW